jgi:Zn-finger nucleic acid-binding protein
MRCPKDDVTLLMTSRAGIELDYCPECRGVWLDRGELDKLIEREGRDDDRDDDRDARADRDDDRERSWRPARDERPVKKKKRSSFFTELFEMGGD